MARELVVPWSSARTYFGMSIPSPKEGFEERRLRSPESRPCFGIFLGAISGGHKGRPYFKCRILTHIAYSCNRRILNYLSNNAILCSFTLIRSYREMET